jgi:hypothetical protein
MAQEIRAKIDKRNCNKLNKKRIQSEPPTEWEKIFDSYSSYRGLILRISKEVKKLKYHLPSASSSCL